MLQLPWQRETLWFDKLTTPSQVEGQLRIVTGTICCSGAILWRGCRQRETLQLRIGSWPHEMLWFDKPFDRLTALRNIEGLTTPSQVEGLLYGRTPATWTNLGEWHGEEVRVLWGASWPASGSWARWASCRSWRSFAKCYGSGASL